MNESIGSSENRTGGADGGGVSSVLLRAGVLSTTGDTTASVEEALDFLLLRLVGLLGLLKTVAAGATPVFSAIARSCMACLLRELRLRGRLFPGSNEIL